MNSALTKHSRADLAKYNPQRGLQTIAAAEAVEKHYALAKDASKLGQAIRLKLEAQAEFVVWWDTKGPGAEGAGRPQKSRPIGRHFAGKDGLPEDRLVSRWRKKLNKPEDFETTCALAIARYPKILEFESAGAHVGQNTGDTEWFTPAAYAEAARLTLGAIDLDPASTEAANAVIQAAQFFTAEENGLAQRWDGRVWMNPPYAQPLVTQFCQKLAESVQAGTVTAAVVLVNNATETQWFGLLVSVASAVCFPTGRVQFWHPTKPSATPLQGQAVIYIGSDIETFATSFAGFGFLATEIRR